MLLAVDVGSTHTVLGLFEGETLRHTWRTPTPRGRSAAELDTLFRGLLQADGAERERGREGERERGGEGEWESGRVGEWESGRVGADGTDRTRADGALDRIEGLAVSSVVASVNAPLRELAGLLGVDCRFAGQDLPYGMPVRYDPPESVGPDRVVNCVAARRRYGAPVVVVDFGTATTYDVVSLAGEFIGGIIAPGMSLSLEALYAAAPHLPRVPLEPPAHVVGGSTAEALRSGAYVGYLAQVEGLLERLLAEVGAETPVIATGGLAGAAAAGTSVFHGVEPYLTLEGLRLMWGAAARGRSRLSRALSAQPYHSREGRDDRRGGRTEE